MSFLFDLHLFCLTFCCRHKTDETAYEKIIVLVSALALLASCGETADQKAAPLMERIDSLYAAADYTRTLNAIRELRIKHPEAVESRKRALKIWQEASLRQTQQEIARTDSALQAAIAAYNRATTIADRNRLMVRRDSLQIRFDALCGTVRVIHKRQQE